MLLSEQKGLLYDFDAYLEKYSNIGNLSLQYSVMNSTFLESINLTVQIFQSMKASISQSDLEVVLPSYLDNNTLELDRAKSLNELMAYDNHIMNYGYKNIEELNEMYREVTPRRLSEIANEIFKIENLILVIKSDKGKSIIKKMKERIAKLN